MPGKRKLIYEGWIQYAEHVLPKNVGPIQRRETRQAFYAGAAMIVEALLNNLDMEGDPVNETPQDMGLMEGLQQEIDDWTERVKAGRG